MNRGILFALMTALVSGTAIFVNSFGVKFGDPFLYTTLKNGLVAIFLLSSLFLLGKKDELLSLNKIQVKKLAFIGLIGGSIPFLLFFYGLSLGLASVSSFIFRFLFIFATVIAFFFLKEKISKEFILGAAVIFIGNFLLVNGDLGFGLGQILVLIATLFWASEYNYSRKVLKQENLSPKLVAFGRMFFGSLFLLLFLGLTGGFSYVSEISLDMLLWAALASLFLLLYVLFWYSALKFTTISKATSILVLGGPITFIYKFLFLGQTIELIQAIGIFLTVIGVLIIINLSIILKSLSEIRDTIRVFE